MTQPSDDWRASWETDRFRPAYRYGFESGLHGLGRTWEDAEPDLRAAASPQRDPKIRE